MRKLELRVVKSMAKVMQLKRGEAGSQASQSDSGALLITKVHQASWVGLPDLGINPGI